MASNNVPHSTFFGQPALTSSGEGHSTGHFDLLTAGLLSATAGSSGAAMGGAAGGDGGNGGGGSGLTTVHGGSSFGDYTQDLHSGLGGHDMPTASATSAAAAAAAASVATVPATAARPPPPSATLLHHSASFYGSPLNTPSVASVSASSAAAAAPGVPSIPTAPVTVPVPMTMSTAAPGILSLANAAGQQPHRQHAQQQSAQPQQHQQPQQHLSHGNHHHGSRPPQQKHPLAQPQETHPTQHEHALAVAQVQRQQQQQHEQRQQQQRQQQQQQQAIAAATSSSDKPQAIVARTTRGTIRGIVLPGAMYHRPADASFPQRRYAVLLDEAIPESDCGAIIIDVATEQEIGYIVQIGWYSRVQVAYAVATSDTLIDVNSRFDEETHLATMWYDQSQQPYHQQQQRMMPLTPETVPGEKTTVTGTELATATGRHHSSAPFTLQTGMLPSQSGYGYTPSASSSGRTSNAYMGLPPGAPLGTLPSLPSMPALPSPKKDPQMQFVYCDFPGGGRREAGMVPGEHGGPNMLGGPGGPVAIGSSGYGYGHDVGRGPPLGSNGIPSMPMDSARAAMMMTTAPMGGMGSMGSMAVGPMAVAPMGPMGPMGSMGSMGPMAMGPLGPMPMGPMGPMGQMPPSAGVSRMPSASGKTDASLLLPANRKCPFRTCPYHSRGFVRKHDLVRHVITHFEGQLFCGFCPEQLSRSFGRPFVRVEPLKRHLAVVHQAARFCKAQNSTESYLKNRLREMKVQGQGGAAGQASASGSQGQGGAAVAVAVSGGGSGVGGGGGTREGGGYCSLCLEHFSLPSKLYNHVESCVVRQVLEQARINNGNEAVSVDGSVDGGLGVGDELSIQDSSPGGDSEDEIDDYGENEDGENEDRATELGANPDGEHQHQNQHQQEKENLQQNQQHAGVKMGMDMF